jgi:hypothetical protein
MSSHDIRGYMGAIISYRQEIPVREEELGDSEANDSVVGNLLPLLMQLGVVTTMITPERPWSPARKLSEIRGV